MSRYLITVVTDGDADLRKSLLAAVGAVVKATVAGATVTIDDLEAGIAALEGDS